MMASWKNMLRFPRTPLTREALMIVVVAWACAPSVCGVEKWAVRDMVPVSEQWQEWVDAQTQLQISGRYDGRFSNQFHLVDLPVSFAPARNAVLPPNIAKGSRVTVTGVLRKSGSRYAMETTRILLGPHDLDRFHRELKKAEAGNPTDVYALAATYKPIAEFYGDKLLIKDVAHAISKAFNVERTAVSKDRMALQALAMRGAKLGIDKRILQSVRFHSAVVAAHDTNSDTVRLVKRLKSEFDGWDQTAHLAAAVELRYQQNPVETYDTADNRRRRHLHRRLYREVRLTQLLEIVENDGSNAVDVANRVRDELPEESQQIARLRGKYVDYRLARVRLLSRRQLADLDSMLQEFGRGEEFTGVLENWLSTQESRLNNNELDGMLSTAEEYLFAFEHWNVPAHGTKGTDLLKAAWKIAAAAAPKEAESIAQRLERFGWTRMHNRWMTTKEVHNLPRSDIERAMREGRVVAGMTSDQVLGALGEPSRRVRVVSSQHVQEIWVFGEAGSTAITVHMQRFRSQKPADSVATHVSTTQQRFQRN